MKKFLAGLLCLMLCLGGVSLAEESDASVLTYAELMGWVDEYLSAARELTPLNAPIDAEDLTEDGYAFVYEFATFYFDTPDMQSGKLNAMSLSDIEQPGLHGVGLNDSLKDLLSAFYNENPQLLGDEDFAALYCLNLLPTSASWAWLQRNGQQVAVVQYALHEQLAAGDQDGYTDCGLLFTLSQNMVVGIKAYGLSSFISLEQVEDNLGAVMQVQEADHYYMYPTSVIGTDLEPFGREDLTFSGLNFLTVTPEEAIALWGNVADDVWMADGDAYLRTLYFDNAYLTFAYNADKTFSHLDFMTIDGSSLEGPRGVRIGESLSSVISRFRHSEGDFDGVKEVLYGDGVNAPYGTAEYGDNAAATLRYALDMGNDKHVTLHMDFTVNALSEIMIYCW